VTKAAMKLIDQGYLLADDLPAVVRDATRNWDYATAPPRSSTAQR